MDRNSIVRYITSWAWCIPVLILLAPLVYTHIGLPPMISVADGTQYNGYATNMLAGHGYTIDGTKFSDAREPGYPVFLAVMYTMLGTMNLEAIFILQLLLIGLVGVLLYSVFLRMGHTYLGALAGFSVALWPSFGLSAHDIATEALFTLLVMCLFLVAQRIMENEGTGRHLFLWFGLLSGCATLVRLQLIFFLPFMIVLYLLRYRMPARTMVVNIAHAAVPFLLIVGSWMMVVHQHTGHFAITEGRPEMVLYNRAIRSELSYRQTTQYGVDWLKRSFNGGEASAFLDQYDPHTLTAGYLKLATSTTAVAALKKWSISTILAHPGHYLYGNVIELVKLTYIHHDYSDTINRYLRAGVFVVMYALFLFGIYQFFRKDDRRIKDLMLLAFIFIFYNWLALTPLETIPRFNIPYTPFYFLIGFAGILLWRSSRTGTKKS